jgi:hypothetical protein
MYSLGGRPDSALVQQRVRLHPDLPPTVVWGYRDANTPKVTNLKPNAEQIWSALQTPLEVAPKTWLVLEPIDLVCTVLCSPHDSEPTVVR